jgi:hypothetical protein
MRLVNRDKVSYLMFRVESVNSKELCYLMETGHSSQRQITRNDLRRCRLHTKWQLISKPLIEIYGNGAGLKAAGYDPYDGLNSRLSGDTSAQVSRRAAGLDSISQTLSD